MKKRNLWILILVIGVVTLQACGGEYPQSALHPSSDFADRLSGLFNYIFWLAVGVFVIVEAIIVVTLIRFREKPGDERPKPVHGHTGLEIGWTLLPAVILVLIAIPTIREIFLSDNPPESDALTIEVIGKQWWWEFRYPDEGIITANEAHIPVGQTVEFRVRSADVLHSFWVPRLAGKRDLVPGRENMIWFRPDSTGVFWGQCAEYCGTAHALMSFRVVVDREEEYEAWAQQQLASAEAPTDRLARLGQGVFMTNACIGCHRIDGTQASGVFGPDLTHIGSRTTIAAGILDNTTENMIRWIANPQEVKPGNLMPNMDLTDDQVEQLAAYLTSLR